jgi:hypothetical protein
MLVVNSKKKARVKERGQPLAQKDMHNRRKYLDRRDRNQGKPTPFRPQGYEVYRYRKLRNSVRSFTTDAQGIQLRASRRWVRWPFLNGDLQAEVPQVSRQHLHRLDNIGPEPFIGAVM